MHDTGTRVAAINASFPAPPVGSHTTAMLSGTELNGDSTPAMGTDPVGHTTTTVIHLKEQAATSSTTHSTGQGIFSPTSRQDRHTPITARNSGMLNTEPRNFAPRTSGATRASTSGLNTAPNRFLLDQLKAQIEAHDESSKRATGVPGSGALPRATKGNTPGAARRATPPSAPRTAHREPQIVAQDQADPFRGATPNTVQQQQNPHHQQHPHHHQHAQLPYTQQPYTQQQYTQQQYARQQYTQQQHAQLPLQQQHPEQEYPQLERYHPHHQQQQLILAHQQQLVLAHQQQLILVHQLQLHPEQQHSQLQQNQLHYQQQLLILAHQHHQLTMAHQNRSHVPPLKFDLVPAEIRIIRSEKLNSLTAGPDHCPTAEQALHPDNFPFILSVSLSSPTPDYGVVKLKNVSCWPLMFRYIFVTAFFLLSNSY